jgi:AcrR family transcriptional regulator
MADSGTLGRPNQRSRTRQDLEEVAEEAMVSRATAYRYFSGIEALLTEAALDVAMPEAEALFAGAPAEPIDRLLLADRAVMEMVRENETALRAMLIHSLQQQLAGTGENLPVRQNRRTPLIEAALAPARPSLSPETHDRLVKALALIIGTESRIAFKDVLRIGDDEADAIRRWMIGALVEAARRA